MLNPVGRRFLAGVPGAALIGLVAATSAQAEPRVEGVALDRSAVIGREVKLRFRAVDPRAPVSGLVVSYGADSFASSACRPPDSRGRAPGGVFRPGAPVTLQARQTFRRAGARPVLARIDAGGCSGTTSIYQPLTVTPTRRGEPARPLVVGTPVREPSLLPPELVPGGTPLPGVDLPDLPPLVGAARAAAVARGAATCPNARRRIGRSRKARRQARLTLVCLINSYRRGRGRSRLRENGRLIGAAGRHSRAMIRRRFFSHLAPGGVDLRQRLSQARYLTSRSWLIGENLALTQGSPLRVLNGWIDSPPHRANLSERRFHEIGVGVAAGTPRNRRRGVTVTANFGFRR